MESVNVPIEAATRNMHRRRRIGRVPIPQVVAGATWTRAGAQPSTVPGSLLSRAAGGTRLGRTRDALGWRSLRRSGFSVRRHALTRKRYPVWHPRPRPEDAVADRSPGADVSPRAEDRSQHARSG